MSPKQKSSVVIQGYEFNTQKDLKERCENIKNSYEIGEPIEGADYAFLLEVFRYHPCYSNKAKCSEPSITTGLAAYGTTCFYMCCEEGVPISIACSEAVKGAFGVTNVKSDLLNDYKAASRTAIASQIQAFRKSSTVNGLATCAITGDRLEQADVHIDHEPPKYLDTLLLEFTKANAINPLVSSLTTHHNGGRISFSDEGLANSWRLFHQENAVLRVLNKAINLSLDKPDKRWPEYINQYQPQQGDF